MLGYYLKFNNIEFPNPQPPTMNVQTIENVQQSEAGTDLVVVVRAAKHEWTFNFNLSYLTKERLRLLCQQESVTMDYMGNTYQVRLRDFQESLIEGSEWMSSQQGLYSCSVKVTEF